MNAVILLSLLAVTSADYAAKTLVRAPKHDTAIIQSHRLGGNFAYSAHEGHAYAETKPIIGHRTVPVAVSYHKAEPVVHSTTKYVKAEIPRVGYAYPSYSNSYDQNNYGLYAAQDYPDYGYGYGYGQAPLYGQYSGAAYDPAYSYGYPAVANGYSYGNAVVAPAYSYGLSGVSGTAYDHNIAAPVYGHVAAPAYGYETGPVYGHNQGVYGHETGPVYGRETVVSHGHNKGGYGHETVVSHGHNKGGYGHETVISHGHNKGGYGHETGPVYGRETVVSHGNNNGNYGRKTVVSHGYKKGGHDSGHYSVEAPVYSPGYSLSYAPDSYAPVYPHKVETHTTVVKGRKYGKGHHQKH